MWFILMMCKWWFLRITREDEIENGAGQDLGLLGHTVARTDHSENKILAAGSTERHGHIISI